MHDNHVAGLGSACLLETPGSHWLRRICIQARLILTFTIMSVCPVTFEPVEIEGSTPWTFVKALRSKLGRLHFAPILMLQCFISNSAWRCTVQRLSKYLWTGVYTVCGRFTLSHGATDVIMWSTFQFSDIPARFLTGSDLICGSNPIHWGFYLFFGWYRLDTDPRCHLCLWYTIVSLSIVIWYFFAISTVSIKLRA